MSTRTSEEPPRDFDGLKDLLISRRESLPRRLVQVAAFALENPDEVAFGTVASVAAQAKVQPSTLIRFAQTLGYAGFTDLQDVFRAQLKSHWPDYRERLARIGDRVNDRRDGTSGLLDGFAETAIASIDRLRHTVSTAWTGGAMPCSSITRSTKGWMIEPAGGTSTGWRDRISAATCR